MEGISDQDVLQLSQPRRRIVETVSRLSRKSNFRQQVLHAYGNRCAVTRVQLRLVDAVHVLPVGAPDSSDDVRNGIALAPTYHRAYDNGLIFLDDDYNMKINPAKITDLSALNFDGGMQTFSSHLGRVNLPPDRRQWPNLALIRKANTFRRIAVWRDLDKRPPENCIVSTRAKELDDLRSRWLNPPEWTKTEVWSFPARWPGRGRDIDRRLYSSRSEVDVTSRHRHRPSPRVVPKDAGCAASLKKRTLTNLYNQRPAWFDLATRSPTRPSSPPTAGTRNQRQRVAGKAAALNLERAAK